MPSTKEKTNDKLTRQANQFQPDMKVRKSIYEAIQVSPICDQIVDEDNMMDYN